MFNDARRLAILLGTLLWTAGAGAEPVEGRVQLGFDADLLGHRSLTAAVESGEELSSSETVLGLGAGSYGVGLGYGLSENVLLRARFGLLSRSREWDGEAISAAKDSGASVQVMADFFPSDGDIRPFAGPLLGYEVTSSQVQNADSYTSDLLLGAQGGVHAFVTPSFSVDPSVMIAYATGSTEAGGVSADLSGVVVGVRLGLNGWLGEARRAEEPSTAGQNLAGAGAGSEGGQERTPFAGEGSDRRQSIALSASGRLMLELQDGGEVRFKFIDMGASPGDSCDGVALSFGAERDALPLETAAVIPWGSSQALVAGGIVSPSVLAVATNRGAVLSACGEEFELDVLARRQISRIVKGARR